MAASDSRFSAAVGFDGFIDLLDDDIADDSLPVDELAPSAGGSSAAGEALFARAGLTAPELERREFSWLQSLAHRLPNSEAIPSFNDDIVDAALAPDPSEAEDGVGGDDSSGALAGGADEGDETRAERALGR